MSDKSSLEAELKGIESVIEKLEAEYDSGLLELGPYLKLKQGYETRKAELERRLRSEKAKTRSLIADYHRERQAFESLLQADCRKRIVLFCGKSGSGKTTLLNACMEQVPASISCVPIQLRGGDVGVAEIFSQAGRRLGWERLPNLTAQVAALESVSRTQVDDDWLKSIQERLDATLRSDSPAERQRRRAALTDAWFQDLQAWANPLLLMLDTFEQAPSEAAEWIGGPLLRRVPDANALRVLLAGQTVPDAHDIEWGHCCEVHQLYGVPEAEHWLPVVEALGRYIPHDPPLIWLAGVCHALQGSPRSIMGIIRGLPRREGAT